MYILYELDWLLRRSIFAPPSLLGGGPYSNLFTALQSGSLLT